MILSGKIGPNHRSILINLNDLLDESIKEYKLNLLIISYMVKKIVLVTGCAGFIGMHISLKLIKMNYRVVGIDNLNSYYDIKIKRQRLKELSVFKNFTFFRKDLRNFKVLESVYKKFKFKKIVHLATTGIRFFTVYGPYGRPDMALFKFTKNIIENKKLMCSIMEIYLEILHT